MHVGKSVLGCPRLLVADKAINPRIDDFDADFVRALLERRGHVHTLRRVPHNPKVLAVHRYLGQILYVAEIEP